jgi:hypothetical protein
MPAARCQTFKDASLGSDFVQMERLRVKLGGELFLSALLP